MSNTKRRTLYVEDDAVAPDVMGHGTMKDQVQDQPVLLTNREWLLFEDMNI